MSPQSVDFSYETRNLFRGGIETQYEIYEYPVFNEFGGIPHPSIAQGMDSRATTKTQMVP
ncbi:MAG: hypothetical protein V7K32_28310 [Nostoc sp.]|uniref:hypothetical protein n=1 Tax=Nostoc sp. TaxID=1180 RepID=UPI002FF63C0E